MKRLLIILLISLFFSIVSPISAQEFDYQHAYQNYLDSCNQYRESHDKYVIVKDQYLTYQTLTSKNKALIATREMLEKRSQALRTYLTALRIQLAKATGVIGDQINSLYMKLDKQIDYFVKHEDSLTSAPTLEKALEISAEFENKYLETETIIYQALGEIIGANEAKLYHRTYQLISETEKKVLEIKEKNEKKASLLENWLSEAQKKLGESQEKQHYAETTIRNLKVGGKTGKNFEEAQFALKESNQHLKEAVFYLKEIIQKIKYD